MELACAFIQRTSVEKALPEIDKRLATVTIEINMLVLYLGHLNSFHLNMTICSISSGI